MSKRFPFRGVYPILDRGICLERRADPKALGLRWIGQGTRLVQLRAKGLTTREWLDWAAPLVSAFNEAGAMVVINDRPDIALATGAQGVHLGQQDMPVRDARMILGMDSIIGVSTHNPEEACAAEIGGADYVGFGPVFSTGTKKDASPVQGLERLHEVFRATAIPVVAIGGITPDRLPEVIAAGAACGAMISALMDETALTGLQALDNL